MGHLLVDQMSYELEAAHYNGLVVALKRAAELQARAKTQASEALRHVKCGLAGRQGISHSPRRGGSHTGVAELVW